MIKISIIIPVYNAQKYLVECIQSVQMQTMKEIEILCVNDGSTDTSLFLLEKIRCGDSRLHIFEQTNQGAGAARNLALRNAKGEFVCFLDSDDYLIDPMALDKLYHCAITQQSKICAGEFFVFRNGKAKLTDTYKRLNDKKQQGNVIEYVDYQYDYFYQNYIYLREMLIENHILFPNYRRFEDPPFFARAMWEAGSFCIVDVPFYCYRVVEKQINYTDEMMTGQMQGMIDNLRFSGEKGLKKLHRITYYRILQSCDRELNKFMQESNENLLKKLKEANAAVRWEWLEERTDVDRRILKPLADMLESSETTDLKDNKGNIEKWILPIRFLRSGECLALYGAGEVGKSFFKQIRENEDYTLCVWVDRNYGKIAGTDYNIVSPGYLTETEFDHVIIAIADIEVALDIIDDLRKLGIPAHKIVWSNVG